MFKIRSIKRIGEMDWTEFILFNQPIRFVARPLSMWKYFTWSNYLATHRFFFQCPWFTLFVK